MAAHVTGGLPSKSDLELGLVPIRADLGLLKYAVAALTALNTGILIKLLTG